MERSYVPCKPDHMTALEQVSHEAMVFMRGYYCLDEVGNGRDELKFKQGKRTILTVYVKEDRFDFMLIYGQKEREVFEARRAEFPLWVLEIYDNAKTYHDGKWMMFPVSAPEQLEELKPLIFIKKKPNRKPFPKEGAVYGQCGQRCDLCVHYTGQDEDRRQRMLPLLNRVYGELDWSMRCGGCESETCHCKDQPCPAKSCAAQKGLAQCRDCGEHPCVRATTSDHMSMIHSGTYAADEITWGILPYVPRQYEEE